MPYDIIVRFPDKKMADEFCGQMCDGFGEGLCNFSPWYQVPDTDGTKQEHFQKIKADAINAPVHFVSSIEQF